MVVVQFSDGKQCYMDGWLYTDLAGDKGIKNSLQNDEDYVLLFDGPERGGKSTLAQQVARVVDPSFNHERMCIDIDEFSRALDTAEKGQAVVFDEAYRGLSSEGWQDKVAKLLRTKFMEMGQKNLFVIIVAPNMFLLHKYIVLHRSRSFIHVYRKDGKRGFFATFDSQRKLQLYIKGKQTLSYTGKGFPGANYYGRFTNQYVIDEQKYREKKAKSYKELDIDTENKGRFFERNKLIMDLHKNKGMTFNEIEEYLQSLSINLSYDSIRRICMEGNNR
jgi:hypothetical protein